MVFKPWYKDKKTGQKKQSKKYWFKFMWKGTLIKKPTRHTNMRIAEQIEAACKTALAKGEYDILDTKLVPTLESFAETRFLAYVRSHFQAKPKTIEYYEYGIKALLENTELGKLRLDVITPEDVSNHAAKKLSAGLQVSTVNRQLQILNRILNLAVEWKVVETRPKVRLLPGEVRRERVLTSDEECDYLAAAQKIGDDILLTHEKALTGVRALKRGQLPLKPRDPYIFRDVVTVLLDCALRPEECFRLRRCNILDGEVEVHFGKTDSARRRIPMSPRVAAILTFRLAQFDSEWVFPAPTRSGHAEPSTIRDHHTKALALTHIPPFVLYTLRHTCLTRWAPHMDPYTLAYLAGHASFATTKRYIHPEKHTVLSQMEKARQAKDSTRIGTSQPASP